MKEDYNPRVDNRRCEEMIYGTYLSVLVMCNGQQPYAVPMNHGFMEGRFYFHCAKEGRKLDTIGKNPRVSYVIKNYYGSEEDFKDSMQCHGQWESVIAYGRARVVEGRPELKEAFKNFMACYDKSNYNPSKETLDTTSAVVIDVEEMTARREFADRKTDFFIWKPVND